MQEGRPSPTPPLFAIAGLTVREGRRRPALPVAVAVLGVALLAAPELVLFGFGREAALVEDVGVSTLRLSALIAAVLFGAAAVARDRADGGERLLPLLARPVTPASWLVGRWFGALALAGAAIFILSVPFAVALKLAGGAPGFAAAAAGRAAVEALALVSFAVASGALLPAGAAALATFVVFALGHLRPQLEGLAPAGPGRAALAALVPDLALGPASFAGPRAGATLLDAALVAAAWLGLAAAVAERRVIR